MSETTEPERIYINPGSISHEWDCGPFEYGGSVEYIRADAPELVRLRKIAELVHADRSKNNALTPKGYEDLDSLLAAQHKTEGGA